MLSIYTDGACKGNPGIGSWAYIVINPTSNNPKIIVEQYSAKENTTNNAMELTAILQALILLGDLDTSATIYSDSAYAINCLTQGWYKQWRKNGWVTSKKEQVKNRDLWEQILRLYENMVGKGHKVLFCKVKGHADNTYNNYVDMLANQAIREVQQYKNKEKL